MIAVLEEENEAKRDDLTDQVEEEDNYWEGGEGVWLEPVDKGMVCRLDKVKDEPVRVGKREDAKNN
jgi:hypothetical protein